MRVKILLILALVSAVFISSTIGTLSNYTSAFSFGVSISPDSGGKKKQAEVKQQQEQPGKSQNTGNAQN